MIAAPLPIDENERLAELRALEILDTPSEARFDRIVELAAQVFHVPIAYVALIDESRQWFKAQCGLEASETQRGISFCSHTILHNGPLVIPDASTDPRFHDSPLVLGKPHIRFYAGYPLAGPGGHKIGTLCLADGVPRTIDDSGIAVLGRLAALAEHELGMVDVIRAQRELLDTKSQLLEAQQRLSSELAEAAAYVRSLLPAPLEHPVRTEWQFVSSSQLGGDFLGYRWLDDDRFALYLLDVMGHGVGAALLSTSVEAALRGRTLAGVAFDDPVAVVTALNRAFPMEENGGRFFTLWYGVYDARNRSLAYVNAGHPPALLFSGDGVSKLETTGSMVGIAPHSDCVARRVTIPGGSRLYLYSDGAYEVETPDGDAFDIDGLERMIGRVSALDRSRTAEVLRLIGETQGKADFQDDVSLLEAAFE